MSQNLSRGSDTLGSFLHISRPEVDLPEATDPYAPEVYAKAAENLERMLGEAVLVQDPHPTFYIYRLTMEGHVQTGLVAAASVEAYDRDRIKKHEFTRPKKEDDRVRQIDALDAQTGPVFLVYPSDGEVDGMLSEEADREPELDVTAADGVRHQIWTLSDPVRVGRLTALFDGMSALYVADGHHRSAAASRVTAARRAANPAHTGEEPYNYFLSVIFPHSQMQILPYNRVVRDLNGLEREQMLERIAVRFRVETSAHAVLPGRHAEFGMYLPGQWYRLVLDEGRIPWDDPVQRLDVSLLAGELIEPILGIADQRRDERIDFVGGIRGLEALEKRVDSGEMAVAFSLYPTSMEALMAVADAGEVMPPKSTWFEPKLADGLVSHLLGGR
ncbi:MAG: DUF1015 domain-containing protein [Candidatus Sedimenticola endophacoides]|uniref:DUF1015 domain-containing protein n=2 Tax=Candidatus Sedimenticola endophacoides TaxID=2548426 RepID=A0A6N4E8Y4_9GAMM|nr:MAG: DUF1015 domain-containing protein [Candidatus Sedimenticola endophacoides]PUE00702.1 MAG: DUF1015 domain-containing protein [Candidatus Sedimenticola endophacoides]PUE05436.1 MAG: DUF1015 domain-containing protein [Candidatus Sedimenticola endophacoides]